MRKRIKTTRKGCEEGDGRSEKGASEEGDEKDDKRNLVCGLARTITRGRRKVRRCGERAKEEERGL